MRRRRGVLSSRGFVRGLGAVGRLMVTSGIVLLLLVAYQLWGTNLQTNRAQDQLRREFEARLAQVDDATVEGPASTSSTAASSAPPNTPRPTTGPPETTPAEVAGDTGPVTEGTPLGRISIPSIGLKDYYIVQGTSVTQLKRGAGHYSDTPLPGQKGNAGVAGHRTTYGAPFHNIDQLVGGDLVIVDTFQGQFRYAVTEQRIVAPSEVSVLDDRGGNTLTLTACHPKFSARERIIVFAVLVGNPVPTLPSQVAPAATPTTTSPEAAVPAPEPTAADRASIDEFTSEPIVRSPGLWWGIACMALWLVVRLLASQGHRSARYPRVLPYLIGTPLCLVLLFNFFEHFSYEAFTHTLGVSI